jgi:hypothetical protein
LTFKEFAVLYPGYPSAIQKKYGFVRRARFCYLYTQSGKRLVDMYQEAGRAVLGWRGNAATAFKNVFARGAAGTFCSEEGGRLKKAVRALIPGVQSARWYTGEKAEKSLRAYRVWRPWAREPDCPVAFLPPFPLARDVVIVAGQKSPHGADADSDVLPPCLLAGIARSVHDLLAEIPRRGEAGWSLYDGALLRFWERAGPYLFPKIPRETYGAFALACLDAGLVVSPDYDIPSIVPWNADKGNILGLCSKMKLSCT